jgi:hypothetical protein
VATFAGGFTYGNVITLQTNPTTCHTEESDDISILLSVAFILFIMSLFVTLIIQIILRAYDPSATMPNARAHNWVQLLFLVSATLLLAGFILLDVVLIGRGQGQEVVGAVGIALVGIVGICAVVIGFRS